MHDFRSAEEGFAHNEEHFFGEAGEVKSFFAGCVAATDYGDVAVAVEEAVAGGASAHAESLVFGFVGESEVSRSGTGCHDDGFRFDGRAIVESDNERSI